MNVWNIYALIAIFIISYPIFVKPNKNIMKYMWISYILLGAFLGIYNDNNKNKNY